jgi:predicted transcriptional regulator
MMPRKLIEFHPEDLRALQELADDSSSTLQELMDKAVSDFLKKSGRPTNLREALRESASGKPATAGRKHRPARR